MCVCVCGSNLRVRLTEVPEHRQFMLQRARNKLTKQTADVIAHLKEEHAADLIGIDWNEIDGSRFTHAAHATATVADPEKSTWLLVLNMERAYYLHAFEKGELSAEAYYVLEATMADICAAADGTPTANLGEVYDRIFYDGLLVKLRRMRASHAYETALAYVSAQHEVDHLTSHHDDGASDRSSLHKVFVEHEDNVEKMRELMYELQKADPKAIERFSKLYVAKLVRLKQRHFVEHLKHEGEHYPDLQMLVPAHARSDSAPPLSAHLHVCPTLCKTAGELIDLDAAPLTAEIDEQIGHILAGKADADDREHSMFTRRATMKVADLPNMSANALRAGDSEQPPHSP